MASWPLLLGLRPCFGLLLLLFCWEVPLLASRLENNNVNHGVGLYPCLAGQYFVNGSCEMCPKGTYMDHPNNATNCMLCEVECGINEELKNNNTSCSRESCKCIDGHCKDSNHPEACVLRPCSSGNSADGVSGNATSPGPAGTMNNGGPNCGTRKPPSVNTKGQHSDAVHTLSLLPAGATGSFSQDPVTRTPDPVNQTGPHLLGLTSDPTPTPPGSARNWLLVLCIGVPLFLVLMALAIFCYLKKTDQLPDWCLRWTQPQGQVHNVGGSDSRKSFEMRTVAVVTVNSQCNPEEAHRPLPRGNTDSAISVVLEDPKCTSVASNL